jgi:hypothetical protein
VLPFISVSFGELCLLVSWCAGATCRAATRIITEVGDLVQRTEDSRIGRVLGGRAIESLSGAMCGLHCTRGDEERGFLVEPQNQGPQF